MNEKFVNALNKKSQKSPPVWMMRQAGRYHSHYQKLKEKYSFMELCKQPELAAQVALGPVADFDFDVSILFSDLLFPLEAMGFGLDYSPGPVLSFQLDELSLRKLKPFAEAWPQLEFQKLAMQATRQILPKNKSLIGFVGGPWTLFTYAVEGSHQGSLASAKSQIGLFQPFCELLIPLLKKNIELQFAGGAETVMIFDTAAGELDPTTYAQLCAPQLQKLSQAFPKKIGYYSKGTQWDHVEVVAQLEWAGMGFDHRWSMPDLLLRKTPGFVQGNFDQAFLFLDEDRFRSKLKNYLSLVSDVPLEDRNGWVCGLGHGILPKTPEKNVRLFVEMVRRHFE